MPPTLAKLALAAAALTATCAASAVAATDRPARTKFEPLVMNFQAKPAHCSLTAYFSSIGAGTDWVTRGKIERELERNPAVTRVRPYLRGREGETLLCVHVAPRAAIRPLFRRLAALVPPRAAGRAVTLTAEGGLRFSN